MSLIRCITIGVVGKYHKRQNVNTQQVEIQTIRSPRTTQTTSRTSPSRPLPNTTFNTIPQTQNQYPSYVTRSTHYPEVDTRHPPPYNPHYHQQPVDCWAQQPLSSNLLQPSAPPHPYQTPVVNTLQPNPNREVNTLMVHPPPSYAELFET